MVFGAQHQQQQQQQQQHSINDKKEPSEECLETGFSCLGQEGSISVDWKIAGQNIDSNFHLILQTCIGTVQVPITYTYFHIYFSLFTTSCHSGIRTQILEYDGPIDVIIKSLWHLIFSLFKTVSK